MTYKDALELSNMYTEAAQIAKSRNKYEYHLQIDEDIFVNLLKEAFPYLKDIKKLARSILKG